MSLFKYSLVVLLASVAVFFAPLVIQTLKFYPDYHDYRSTDLESPFWPPGRNLTKEELETWKRDGVVKVKDVLPE